MGTVERDPARRFARLGGTIAAIAGLPREELVIADDGRPLLLLPADEPPGVRDGRIRAALAMLEGRRATPPLDTAQVQP